VVAVAEIQDAPDEVKNIYADLMVSWNFKHIVHFEKIQRFNAVNIEMGYKPILIYSLREVTTYGRESS